MVKVKVMSVEKKLIDGIYPDFVHLRGVVTYSIESGCLVVNVEGSKRSADGKESYCFAQGEWRTYTIMTEE